VLALIKYIQITASGAARGRRNERLRYSDFNRFEQRKIGTAQSFGEQRTARASVRVPALRRAAQSETAFSLAAGWRGAGPPGGSVGGSGAESRLPPRPPACEVWGVPRGRPPPPWPPNGGVGGSGGSAREGLAPSRPPGGGVAGWGGSGGQGRLPGGGRVAGRGRSVGQGCLSLRLIGGGVGAVRGGGPPYPRPPGRGVVGVRGGGPPSSRPPSAGWRGGWGTANGNA